MRFDVNEPEGYPEAPLEPAHHLAGHLAMTQAVQQLSNGAAPYANVSNRDVGRLSPAPLLTGCSAAVIRQLRNRGQSLARIAQHLNQHGAPTALGGRWYGSTVLLVLRRLDAEAAKESTKNASPDGPRTARD